MSVVEVDREQFWDTVADGVVLVDVWSAGCQPCLALTPHLEALAERRGLTLAKLEAPTARRLCMQLRVMGLPTLLLFRDGEEVSRVSGNNLDAAAVDAWLAEHLS
jgi:thioredoxin-like negative regulator of GroEL